MSRNKDSYIFDDSSSGGSPMRRIFPRIPWVAFILGIVFLTVVASYVGYNSFLIEVPPEHIAVLTTKTGKDLANDMEVAPGPEYKGLQIEVLQEGRYIKNPYYWDWEIYPMVVIPQNKMGVRIRLNGEDLQRGHFVASNEKQKGIVKEVLVPGRYTINAIVIDGKTKQQISVPRPKEDYLEIIELWDPKTIPGGYKGVVTNLAADMPGNPNQLVFAEETDENGNTKEVRGTQLVTLEPKTYYKNPYMYRINSIDCRSQRFNLTEGKADMIFPSRDGFPISLDGIIEFRVNPERAAEVYVTYNDVTNDSLDSGATRISEEIIAKIILPNARSFCRIEGSKSSAREFISGETRTNFQEAFEASIRKTCAEQGIEIVQALITRIKPPDAIAKPLRDREVARQQLQQYRQQKTQQLQEANLAREAAMVAQKTQLVEAEREVVKLITRAQEDQAVALSGANRDKEVAELQLQAAQDKAKAILSEAKADASILNFENEADAAGWKIAVDALGGKGQAFATYVLYQKLAPGFKRIMTNTADSPLMRVFENFAPDHSQGPQVLPVDNPPAELKPPTQAESSDSPEVEVSKQ
ncbi:MAG: band 7 protein [Planctomyces sp.]|nr:band 7 protein [Planctomyces sp.]